MLKNTTINKKVIIKIAADLGELNSKVVYVSGAVVSLYINNPSSEIVVDLDELTAYCKLRGIKNDGRARSLFVQAK